MTQASRSLPNTRATRLCIKAYHLNIRPTTNQLPREVCALQKNHRTLYIEVTICLLIGQKLPQLILGNSATYRLFTNPLVD